MKYIKEKHFDIWYYAGLSDEYLKDIIMEYEKSYKFFEDFFNKRIDFKLKLFVYEKPEDVGIAFAAAVIYMIPMILLFLYGEDELMEGVVIQGGIKG